jgi:peptidoglycan hydrolase CwlO-like protein
MMIEQLLFALGGLSISIIGYFLKQSLNDIKSVKEVVYENKSKLSVLENDYMNKINRLNEKFDMLAENIKDLTEEIKSLNNKIK